MNTPYTYLIGWPELSLWYYGVRYARDCGPDDLWTTYRTSSFRVKDIVAEHGDPTVKQIRRTFLNEVDARRWERRVLKRLKVVSKDHWINGNDGTAFDPKCKARGDAHHMRQAGGSDYIKGDLNPMRRAEVAEKFAGDNHWFNRNPEGLKNFCGDNSPLKLNPELARQASVRMTKNNPMKDPAVVAKFKGENSPSKRPEVREKIRQAVLRRNAEKKLAQNQLNTQL